MDTIKIIKIGGNVINDQQQLIAFLKEFSRVAGKKILVHGGGTIATQIAGQLGIEQQMIEGRRITDAETLKVVTMVYAGLANKQIVSQLQALGCNALGVTGADGHLIKAHKRVATIDYGFVGDVDAVEHEKILQLLSIFDTLVIAPISMDQQGQLLNTNADTIAQEVAKALAQHHATDLFYSFEKDGVLLDVNDPNSVIKEITTTYYEELKANDKIFAGMIPKLDNAFAAINAGVKAVHIGNAQNIVAMTEGKSGTKIIA